MYARALQSVSGTTEAFEEILKESENRRTTDTNPYPMRCDTDGGPEFANAAFRGLLARYEIEHVIKDPKDYQALATLDRAIGIVKRMLQRKHDAKGGTWVNNLPGTILAYNNTEHGGIDAEPADVTDDNVFNLKM